MPRRFCDSAASRLTRSGAAAAVAAGFALAFALAANAEVSLQTRASTGVSDNINFAPEQGTQLDETLQVVSTLFGVGAQTARTTTNLYGNLEYFHYVHGTFDDETFGGGTLDFIGTLVPERVRWRITDNFGQTYVDPLLLLRPQNRRDLQIFRTGPVFDFPISARTALNLQMLHSRVGISQSNVDSTRNSAQLSATRTHNARWSSTIGISGEEVRYDEIEGFDFETANLFLTVAAVGSRTNLSMTLGTNQVDNESGTASGPRFNINFDRQVGQRGTLSIGGAHRFSDAGNLFRYTQGYFIDLSQAQDIVATPDPFVSSTAFLTYTHTTEIGTVSTQAFWRKDEYETQTQFDRDDFGLRFMWTKKLNVHWNFAMNGYSAHRNLEGQMQEAVTHNWYAELSRQLGRKFSVGTRAQYVGRDDTTPGQDRVEHRYFIFFDYTRPTTGQVRANPFDSPDAL